jgi:hypothetical protein
VQKEKGEKKMEKVFSKSLVTAIATMLILSTLMAYPATVFGDHPQYPGLTVWVDPASIIKDTNQFTTGTTFIVDVKVRVPSAMVVPPWKLMMFQVGIIYNPNYIQPTMEGGKILAWPNSYTVEPPESWNPNYVFYGKSGTIGDPSTTTIDPDHERIILGETLLSDVNLQVDKDYLLARFNFTVVAVPSKGGVFSCDLNINNDQTFLYNMAGKIISGPDPDIYDGYYELSWAAPPPPKFDVVRADGQPWPLIFDKWFNHVGETFDVKVYIMNLDAAWDATNATFTLSYDSSLIDISGGASDVVIDSAWTTYEVTFPASGQVHIMVKDYATPPPHGNVLIATITFTVIYQGTYPDVDTTDITFTEHEIWNHQYKLPEQTPGKGTVIIEGYLPLPLPWYEVSPASVVMGPEPSIGKTFQISVKINELHKLWYIIGLQFKLRFDATLLDVVSVEEGPFMSDPLWNLHGTFFTSTVSGWPEPGVNVGVMLLPPWEMTEFPNTIDHPEVDNTVAIITFRVIKQVYPFEYSCDLTVTGVPNGYYGLDKDANWVPFAEEKFIDGKYTIVTTPLPGRVIDIYGGASNAGYGPFPDPFPAPYGGQGPNQPMDLVIPQSEVIIYADVSYNYWPVQQKDVSFEVEGPYDHVDGQLVKKQSWIILIKTSARTDENGTAIITFAMPWPCDDPESMLGVWIVTATVNIRDVIVMDRLYFYYDYLVNIFSVKTNKYSYKHCETVEIRVRYGTHSMQYYPALFTAVIKDELNVPIGIDLRETEVGGAVFCTFANETIKLYIHIEKFAFAGYAHVYVNCFDKDPTDGGFAWCPQYEPPPEIFIQPY